MRSDAAFLLRPEALRERGVNTIAAQEVVRAALLAVDSVQAAYTRDQMERGDVQNELGRSMMLSFNRERSADILYQPRPYHFSRDTGANHGALYNYDNHVPLIWYGPGIPAGHHSERIAMVDLAPTLAHLLKVPAPPLAHGRVLF